MFGRLTLISEDPANCHQKHVLKYVFSPVKFAENMHWSESSRARLLLHLKTTPLTTSTTLLTSATADEIDAAAAADAAI